MKLNKNEKTGANTHELEIFIEPEIFADAVSAVFRREGKKYNVPGFRKGKAPRSLIEKMYGEDFFYSDAINEVFPDQYELAVVEAGIEPITRPDVEIQTMNTKDGVVLTAVVTVKPELKVGKYAGLKAEKEKVEVDEAKVDSEIQAMLDRNSRLITREGAAQDGDITNLDYEGFVDDVPFEGGKDSGFRLTLGSGQFIEGFEEQVVGHSAGEEFDINVKFPEEYHAEQLAGKPAVFKIKLNEVQYKELPELDDEFAKDVSEYDTLEELKVSIRERMLEELNNQADLEVENQLVDQIVETLEGEIPDAMYENRVDEMVRDFAFRLEQQGLGLEGYLSYTGINAEDFRKGFEEQAEKQVKMRLALEAVVREEKITATEEDITEEVERIAEKYGMEADKVRELMPVEEIAKDLAVNKAIDFIKEKATVSEKKADSKEEKAEAKPKAKAAVKKKETKEEKAESKEEK